MKVSRIRAAAYAMPVLLLMLLAMPTAAMAETTPPTGSIDATPVGPYADVVTISGTAADSGSGVQSVTVSFSGTASGSICGPIPIGGSAWSCTWDTSLLADGFYTMELMVLDVDLNSSGPITRSVILDNDPPIASFSSFIETTNPQYQHGIGSTMYVNPAFSGSFSARINAVDAGSGMSHVDFPALGTGWAPPGGIDTTPSWDFMYSWSAAAASPGTRFALALDYAGGVSSVPFTVLLDTTPPAGGSITQPIGLQTGASLSITHAAPTDGGSGLASRQLQRRTAVLVSGVCGSYGAWSNIGSANPASPYVDNTILDARCYEYQLRATDNVGNFAMLSTAGAARVNQSGMPGVIVSYGASVDVDEGGVTDTISVSLASAPTASVAITLDSGTQLMASPMVVTFTPANWNTPQTVVVTATDDATDEPNPHPGLLAFAVASTDPAYNGISIPNISAAITDNDVASVDVSGGAGVSVSEAGATSDTFNVFLTSQPSSTVTVSIAPVAAQVTVAPTTITFTPLNWNITQVVTVTAIDDTVDETSPHVALVRLTVTSVDPMYNASAVPDVSVDVADDDTAAASATATLGAITEGAGPEYQHVIGSTVWFNPAGVGSFTVAATATGTGGVGRVTFPGAGGAAGWTPASPLDDATSTYEQTYAWSIGASAPGARSITSTSNTGPVTSAPATFTIAADIIPPTGASIATPASSTTTDSTAPITPNAGSDSQSGIGTWQLQRSASPLAGGVCGSFGAWGNLGAANPSGAVIDALGGDGCVRWQLLVSDRVGNTTTASAASPLKVDRTPPVGTIDALPATARGTVQLSGNVTDAATGIRNVTVEIEGSYSICGTATIAAGRWSCSWTVGAVAPGIVSLIATFIDDAGNRSVQSLGVPVGPPPSVLGPTVDETDRTPPIVTIEPIPAITWSDYVRVRAAADDAGNEVVEEKIQQRSARTLVGTFGAWITAYAEEGDQMPVRARGTTTCFRATAIDAAGNSGRSVERCTVVPLDDGALRALGAWTRVASAGAWGDSVRRAVNAGASLQITMHDPTPQIVVTKCKGCGSIRVLHGARVLGTYSLAAPRERKRQLITLPRLTNPSGAPLRIVVSSKKLPVLVDGLVAGVR